MIYRHYLTFHWEEKASSLASGYRNAWMSINLDTDSQILSDASMTAAIGVIRTELAERTKINPHEIMLFLVNHTVVKL